MDDRARRSREIQDAIGRILYTDWNPIGVEDLPSDEYDGYAGGVYRLLASGAGCEQVAEHLAQLERDSFGSAQATAERSLTAAITLCELDVRL